MKLQTSQEIEALLAENLTAQDSIRLATKPVDMKPLSEWTDEYTAEVGAAGMMATWIMDFKAKEVALRHDLRLARIHEALQKLLARFPERSDSGVYLD
jgi:hypothetical protein